MKRILNAYETLTETRLQEVCARYGARVFAKIRVADVLPIEQSGISSQLYSFALKAHFDFVPADSDSVPLFAVEFDGKGHENDQQRRRDELKDALCKTFKFPLLRVRYKHLEPSYRGLDLLTWMLEVWFLHQEFQKWQESSEIPPGEIFDPSSFVSLPGYKSQFPLWLSLKPATQIAALQRAGKCKDPVPSFLVSVDAKRTYRAIGWVRIDDRYGVLARTGMRSQHFPIRESDLLSEVIAFAIYQELKETVSGRKAGIPLRVISGEVNRFQRLYELRCAAFYGTKSAG